jgi:hypothetical protein
MVSRRLSSAETEPLAEPVRALSRPLENLAHLDPLMGEDRQRPRYLDETHALRPLPVPVRDEREVPETYPTGV